ncbi:MAG: c-type cytochrome [Firmicutes bacterium]|nr:c-type cytochrome [Bacillota bacterium]
MKDPSRLYRWMLLLTSLVSLGFLLAAAVRENLLAEWQQRQRTYRKLLAEKATDARGRELLRNFRIELRQVSVPALGAVDRCVSCHVGIDDPRMTDVPQPYRLHPGEILEHHPVDRFGCTICHQGQGAATNFHDAKAEDAYWEYPLLPPELTQATCLSCHDVTRLPRQDVALVLEGMRLYEEKSCGSCHKLHGRGGALGPALDNEGMKTKHQLVLANLKPPYTTWRWHQAHFRDPAGLVPGSQMKNPTVTESEALALTAYMLSLRQRDIPESYLAPDKIAQKFRALSPQPQPAERLYRMYCFACHGEGTYGRWEKVFLRFIPAIRGPLAVTATRRYLETQIAQGRPGTQMPPWHSQAGGLLPEEIAALAEYLRSTAAASPARATAGGTAAVGRGDAARGQVLFLRSCAGCHGVSGTGGVAPELAHPVFLQAADDAFLASTIRNGRPQTAMPAFQRPGSAGLSDAEIVDLIAFLRSLATPPPGPTAPTEEPSRSGGNP